MGPKVKTVESGGGPATQLGDEFVGFLKQFITGSGYGGTNGGTPMGQTMGATPAASTGLIGGNLLSMLAGTDVEGSLASSIERRQGEDIANLRERYTASGAGNSVGTPAAFAESSYRAQAAPEASMAIGKLRLETMLPLLQIIAQLSGRGISQRTSENFIDPGALAQISGALAGLAQGGGALASGFNAGRVG